MSEQNENPTAQPLPKQMCSIRIMFPVDTDEQAIAFKRKIAEVLSPEPNASMQFSLMTGPPGTPTNAR